MNYEDILEHLGDSGRFSIINISLLTLPAVIAGAFVLTYSLTGLEPSSYHCEIPGCSYTSFNDIPESIYPYDDGEIDYCSHYPLVSSQNGSCPLDAFDLTGSPVPCPDPKDTNFLYGDFEMDATVATEFNLVCDDQFKVALVGSIYMIGLLLGSFFFGYISDLLGRWWALLMSVLLTCTASLLGAFANSYAIYCVTRFFTGFGSMGCFICTFVLCVEIVSDRFKTAIGILIEVPFAVGEVIVAALGIGIKDWRNLQIAISAPMFLTVLIFLVLPESPRWQLAKGKNEAFVKTVKKAAKMNKVEIPSKLLEVNTDAPGESGEASTSPPSEPLGLSSLFSSPLITRITLVMWANWIIITLGYYGISMGVGDLGADVFVNLILVSVIEIPSYFFILFTVDHLGRKPMLVYGLLLTGVGCLSAAFMENEVVQTTLSLIGKFGASGVFALIYLYTAELYPTEIRSTAVGLCSTFARIGGVAAPQVALYLPDVTFEAFPMLLMGSCALFGAFLALLLPETLGSPLMESLSDLQHLGGENSKPFFAWWSTKQLQDHMNKQQEKA